MVTSDSKLFEVTNYDEATFCYFKASTETHLLSPFLGLVLDLCTNYPISTSSLAEKTSIMLKTSNDGNWYQTNEKAVNSLMVMGLIQSI